MTVSVDRLKKLTIDFFKLHWNSEELGSTPKWSEPWHLKGTAPNHNRQGIYAFVRGDDVTYIGTGASKGKKRYEGHGLGARLADYVRVSGPGEYRANDWKLENADYVITLGFEQGLGYLSYALESYLLANIPTEHNANRPGS